ncbi:MAG: ABC transporter permease [Armatimonadetes bacterium]|nr:ABC transporter permease [Armatimonadota bacterium]
MLEDLRELWRYRDLVRSLVMRDLTVRYKNSVLGFFWSLANPLVQVATITIIYKYVLQIGIPNYSAYVLCAFLPWMFFQMSLSDAGESVARQYDLLRKVYFPREALAIASVFANLIHLLLAFGVFFVYLLWLGVSIQAGWLLLPVVILANLAFVMGLAFFVSALSVFYEDMTYLVGVSTSLFFYMCPVLYVTEQIRNKMIPQHWQPIIWEVYHWNPMAIFIEGYRQLLLPPFHAKNLNDLPIEPRYIVISVVLSVAVLIAGYAFFNAKKWQFAERP